VPRIHFLVNLSREDAVQTALSTEQWLAESSVDVAFDPEAGALLGRKHVGYPEFSDCDLVVSFGGDGTLIQAASFCSERRTPILGVFFGRFGFVTQCAPKDVQQNIRQFLDGESDFEERMMLKGELVRHGKVVATLHALNEVAVQRHMAARLLFLTLRVDWQEITMYPADGVLVATPTGSTAYSLSAGGPVVDPRVQAMILTPVAPHTLAARPLVLSPESRIEFGVQIQGDAMLSADGQWRLNMLTGDEVVITRSERVTRLVQVDRSDFLVKLRERLLWGARS
jgi:NAD+ kinase